MNGNTINRDVLNDVSLFGGSNHLITSQNFQGGRVNYIFGGGVIDLSNAKLAPGNIYLKANTIFGVIRIKVPEEWEINIVNNMMICGGFLDKRNTNSTDKNSILVISSNFIFGGGDLIVSGDGPGQELQEQKKKTRRGWSLVPLIKTGNSNSQNGEVASTSTSTSPETSPARMRRKKGLTATQKSSEKVDTPTFTEFIKSESAQVGLKIQKTVGAGVDSAKEGVKTIMIQAKSK